MKPLLHFVLLGVAIFGVRQLTDDGRALGVGAEPIVVSAAQVAQLRAGWIAATGRAPRRAELEAAVQRHADEELLLREALRGGLDRSDPVVRQRLVRNVRFARAEPALAEGVALAEALALGMAARDGVARRRLIQVMEERLAAGTGVTDAQVRAYVAARADRYAAPRRVSFDHVFLGSDRHGDALPARAAALGRRLPELPLAEARRQGDPFLLGTTFPAQSQADLARSFGAAFAREAVAAPPGAWAGPIASAYGVHFVRVSAVLPATAPDADAVLRQARYALLEEREREAVRQALVRLRASHPLRIEWPELAMAGVP